MYRIGRNKDSIRPLMIEFKSRLMKNLVMENRNRMTQLDEDLKSINISHDFTKEQKEKCKKLVAEAKEKQSKDSGEFIHRVRGDPSNLKIIRIKRN